MLPSTRQRITVPSPRPLLWVPHFALELNPSAFTKFYPVARNTFRPSRFSSLNHNFARTKASHPCKQTPSLWFAPSGARHRRLRRTFCRMDHPPRFPGNFSASRHERRKSVTACLPRSQFSRRFSTFQPRQHPPHHPRKKSWNRSPTPPAAGSSKRPRSSPSTRFYSQIEQELSNQ